MAPATLDFTCNICGRAVLACPISRIERETVSCRCGSTLRTRSVIYALSLRLFGRALPLPDFPRDKTISGVGLSDQKVYSKALARKFDYRNTYLDKAPRLDIANPSGEGGFDFLISSEVLEHVPPLVDRAFRGMASLLKPGGALIFSVPYDLEPTTREHFPDLFEFQILEFGGAPVLLNRARDGTLSVYDKLVFHGGKGQVVEMRVFGFDDVLRQLAQAGFRDITTLDHDAPEFGIIHSNPVGRIISATRGA